MRQGRALQPGREPDPRRDAAAAEEAGKAAGGLRLDGGGERGKAGKRGAPHPRRPVPESGRGPARRGAPGGVPRCRCGVPVGDTAPAGAAAISR